MSTTSVLQSALKKVIDQAGAQVRIRPYYKTVGSVWDDDVTLTGGSDIWTSGVSFPVRGLRGTSDAFLMEQGKIDFADLKLFVSGGIDTAGSSNIIKIGIGSPPSKEYSMITDGTQLWENAGTSIYKKLYIRKLPTGSLIGE